MSLQKCGLNLNRSNEELQPHGTPSFPCAGYASAYTDGAEDAIPWHWHAEFEVIYIKSGNLKLQIPEKTFHLKQGEGIAVNSNILHSAAAKPYCELQSFVFNPLFITGSADSVFAEKYITPLISSPAFDGCPFLLVSHEQELFEKQFTEAFRALSGDLPGYEFTVRQNLSGICYSLCQKYGGKQPSEQPGLAPDNLRIRTMLDYIHSHFCEDLNLAQIAEAANIGERECLRCFRRTIQISPVQYLIKYRIMQGASLLLREPGKSVSNIAQECGFDSPGNFSQLFRRYYKCSPKEYRQRKQE
ncbi:AraC family transcriptional regulator [uncultured Clostridium sp.]|uniref:AraC family transcriptional regulator n=1 Tax=uncultured Clostridium sp. TaxID=59620 RepID=UPI0025CE00AD|nr:AraC family transcriptional regulator [uncultured Clostridium sp.]